MKEKVLQREKKLRTKTRGRQTHTQNNYEEWKPKKSTEKQCSIYGWLTSCGRRGGCEWRTGAGWCSSARAAWGAATDHNISHSGSAQGWTCTCSHLSPLTAHTKYSDIKMTELHKKTKKKKEEKFVKKAILILFYFFHYHMLNWWLGREGDVSNQCDPSQ